MYTSVLIIELDLVCQVNIPFVFVFVFVFIMRSSNPYKVDTYGILNLSYTVIIQR